MEMGFWTFVLVFLLVSFALAFLELALKSSPVTGPEFEKTYDMPAGLDRLDFQQGAWRRTDTGALATRAEVQGAGLIWREPGASTSPSGTPPGSPKAAAEGKARAQQQQQQGAASAVGAVVAGAADKKKD